MEYPFDTVNLTSETIDTFGDTYKLLKSKFRIEHTGDIDFHLEDFKAFKDCDNINVKGSYAIKNARTDCYVLFVEVDKIKRGGSRLPELYNYREYQSWGLAYLKKDCGRAFIRPETLADKLIELVHPVELDFYDDKAFSDTFYVLVDDRYKAESAMDRDFRNVVMDVRHEDIVIEVINHTLIIGHHKPIMPETTLKLAEFIVRLASNC